MYLRGIGCSEARSYHCTPAWVESETPSQRKREKRNKQILEKKDLFSLGLPAQVAQSLWKKAPECRWPGLGGCCDAGSMWPFWLPSWGADSEAPVPTHQQCPGPFVYSTEAGTIAGPCITPVSGSVQFMLGQVKRC